MQETAFIWRGRRFTQGWRTREAWGGSSTESYSFLTGKKALCYGEFETEETATAETETDKAEKPKAFMVKTLEDAAYIPTVIISRKPTGGGTTLEPLNLIGRKWKESFLSDGTAKVYQLTAKDLDADKVAVRIMTKEGEWTDKKEGKISRLTERTEL